MACTSDDPKCFLLNFSNDDKIIDNIRILNFEKALWDLSELMKGL